MFIVSMEIEPIESCVTGLTNRILHAQAVELCLCERSVVQTTIDAGWSISLRSLSAER
jgi:hypothetical protein